MFFFFKDSFVYFLNFLLTIEGGQGMPPLETPLWHAYLSWRQLKSDRREETFSAFPSAPGMAGWFLIAQRWHHSELAPCIGPPCIYLPPVPLWEVQGHWPLSHRFPAVLVGLGPDALGAQVLSVPSVSPPLSSAVCARRTCPVFPPWPLSR